VAPPEACFRHTFGEELEADTIGENKENARITATATITTKENWILSTFCINTLIRSALAGQS
jgi:hypothetical protein